MLEVLNNLEKEYIATVKQEGAGSTNAIRIMGEMEKIVSYMSKKKEVTADRKK